MAAFDFISGDDFRAVLETDYRELNACMDAQAWKAVHVLAGSIIEAVLLDYLIASNYQNRPSEEILKMDLGGAIAACKSEKILSEVTADLSSVVRQYRNLIHPGRTVRLGEKVDKNTAAVAQRLVEMIVSEISQRRSETFGYTAEQIVSKIERDSSFVSILEDVLKSVNVTETRRLLLNLLPQRYFDLRARETDSIEEHLDNMQTASSLEKSFRIAFDVAPDEVKKAVAERFTRVLKEDSEYRVTTYEEVFFKASDLAYLSPDEVPLVKKHLLSRMAKGVTPQILQCMEGIGRHLNASELEEIVDVIVKALLYGKDNTVIGLVRKFIENEYMSLNNEQQNRVTMTLDKWIKRLRAKGQDENATIVEHLNWGLGMPF